MELLVEIILPAILYILGSILLVVVIIISLKILKAINNINRILEDTYEKSQSLNGFFSIIDTVTDKVSSLSDTFTEKLTEMILALFKRKVKEKKNKNEEEEE